MDYNLYTAEDFASDESFVDWYLKRDSKHVIFWDGWISCHPEKLDEIFNAERILDLLFLKLNVVEFSNELSSFTSFLENCVYKETDLKSNRTKLYVKVFITLFCTVALSICSWYFIRVDKSVNPDMITYEIRKNPIGQRSIFRLSDGTKVTLNANSHLRFPTNFKGRIRKVELKGEAYFEVTKNPNCPFIVKTGEMTTTVLGTSFNINTECFNKKINVALVEGAVKINLLNSNDSIFLRPNQSFTFNKQLNSFTKTKFDIKEVTGWKDGVIYFNHASFEEVAQKMKSNYGINLLKNTGKLNWDYTGEFENVDYLTIVKSICFAKKLNYKIVNDTIIIKK